MENLQKIDCSGCPAVTASGRLCQQVIYAITKELPRIGVDTTCDMRSSPEIARQYSEFPEIQPIAKAACSQVREQLKASGDEAVEDVRRKTPFYGAYY